MLLRSRHLAKTDIPAGNRSIGRSLVLYWLCMALAMLAAALLLLSVTGVLSRTARQFGETAALQQNNNAALFTAQMDALSAQGIELSETVSGELERFLASRSLSFDALNDDPALIAELETALIPSLETTMAGSTCSGVYFCLDATANTSLPQSKTTRMGVYLRYSGLRSAHPSGSTACFRGTVDAARANGLQLHNRWNPELDTSLIPGYRQVMTWEGDRLSGGCLWTERVPLLDTWENVTLLCVPVRDGSGTVRGVCGMELSELYFGLSHSTVSGPYGSFVMLLAPMNGDTLLLDKAMLGSTEGTDLSASGEMKIRGGRDYDTFIWNDTAYLGKYQIIPGRLADGYPLAAVTLVPESGYHNRAQSARIGWVMGSLGFLVGMLALAAALSRRFSMPITQGFAAARSQEQDWQPTGIREIDELTAYFHSRLRERPSEDALPWQVESLVSELIDRAKGLTSTERVILRYYAEGYAVKDISGLLFISVGTVKGHNSHIYSKLGVNSYDSLKAYLDVLAVSPPKHDSGLYFFLVKTDMNKSAKPQSKELPGEEGRIDEAGRERGNGRLLYRRGVSISRSLPGMRWNMAQQSHPLFQSRRGAGIGGDAHDPPHALRAGTGGRTGKGRGGGRRVFQLLSGLRQAGVRPMLSDLRGSGSVHCLCESIAGARRCCGRGGLRRTGVSCRGERKNYNRRR